MTSRRHILLVVNPTAGSCRRGRLAEIIRSLEERGCIITRRETRKSGDAERFAANIDCGGFDAVVVAGGDGTINEVLNGLPNDAPPLAILPLGTINVLAKEIDLPSSIQGLADTVTSGPSRPVSVGEANGRRFFMMASVGLDADIVENVDLNLKRRIGKLAYLYETIKQFITKTPVRYRLRIGDGEHEVAGAVIANGRYYAGRFVTSLTADLETPCLDICHLTRFGRLALPSYLISLGFGRLASHAGVRIDRVTALALLAPIGAPLQADGELLCRLPAHIRILPAAVRLIFPGS
ncbi:MAG: diacylglycerol/lipid kinase family protein [Geminicoccaceae bacterium]